MIHVDVIEHCNFKCYFCAAKDITTPQFMDVDMFKRLVQESADLGVQELNLVPMKGEPFLHPHIYEMLDFATQHMKMVNIFSNATAINVHRLMKVNMSKVVLNISQYGRDPDEFCELTQVSVRLWEVFHDRLRELSAAGIPYTVFMRTRDYDFDYDDHRGANVTEFDGKSKCKYHHQPRVYPSGKVSFCLFIESETTGAESVMYSDISKDTVEHALTHPIRYKFYDSQKICTDFCQSHDRDCLNRVNMSTIKLIHLSKTKYEQSKTEVDEHYDQIYSDIVSARSVV